MVCLETDFMVAFLRGNDAAGRKMERLKQVFSKITVTPISASELFFGACKSKRAGALETAKGFLSTLELLDFDLSAAAKAGEILAQLEKKGQKIGEKDSLIAAIALRHKQPLVTRNVKHFSKIPGLEIEEW